MSRDHFNCRTVCPKCNRIGYLKIYFAFVNDSGRIKVQNRCGHCRYVYAEVVEVGKHSDRDINR